MQAALPTKDFVALDVFRGLAALLMVLNHSGFAWLSADAATMGWTGAVVFLGGFAPVMFFFATGAGMGLSSGRLKRTGGLQELLWKAGLLVVADQLLFLRHGQIFGLDFFSFIALSMVVVSLVDITRHPARNAFALVGLVLIMRYGLVPLFKNTLPENPWITFLMGSKVLANVSYPLAPWIVFPLMAYGLARIGWFPWLASGNTSNNKKRTWILVLSGTLLLVTSLVLFLQGTSFYRWGMMNAAFFMLSVGVIASFVVISEILSAQLPSITKAISLRGVEAFLVVPVHYGLIQEVVQLWPAPRSIEIVAAASALTVLVTFIVSRWLAQGIAYLPATSLVPLLGTLLGILALTVWLAGSPTSAALAVTTCGQILVAAILHLRPIRKQVPTSARG